MVLICAATPGRVAAATSPGLHFVTVELHFSFIVIYKHVRQTSRSATITYAIKTPAH